MSSAEFTQWIAYSDFEPFGYPIERYDMGVITSQIVDAINRSIPIDKGKKRPKSPKPSDFYPKTAADSKKRGPDLTPAQREHIRKKHAKRKSKK